MGWGMATMEYGEIRGPFYRTGGWEGRQCGEGNVWKRSAPLMAFKPLVLGGESRGRRLVQKGKRRSSGTRFCAEEATRGYGGTAARRRSVVMWCHREEEDEAEALGVGASSLREGGCGSRCRRCTGRVGR
jgi:hypothetical protein